VAAVVATESAAAELVPEVAPQVRRAGSARLTLSPLSGAVLPRAVRTADGRIAWQARGAAVVLAETSASRPTADDEPLMDLAAHLPFELDSASRREEETDVTPDGLPVVGKLPGRPLAVACGFSGLPVGFAFAAARWVADSLLRGTDPTPDALRAERTPLALPDV
jgi:glycine/D-amino acid oxidase-like deaminating enzyme